MSSYFVRYLMVEPICLALSTVVLASCALPSEPENRYEPVVPPPVSERPAPAWTLPAQAYEDRSLRMDNPGYSGAELDEIAEMPVAVFQLRSLFTAGGTELVQALRARNPEIVIFGVVSTLNCNLNWNNPNQRERFSLSAQWYDLLHAHGAWTTEGEPAYMWREARMVNPMSRQSLDRRLLDRYIDLICLEAQKYPGVFDGIFHDYMSLAPYVLNADGTKAHGQADLDGDGIPFDEDPAEREVWIEWQRELARQLQARFGPGLIQIANGRLPTEEPTVAQQLAGVVFQDFPTLVWELTPLEGLELATRLQEPGQLEPRRGRYWNLYWPAAYGQIGDIGFRRLASLLTGDIYEYRGSTENEFYGMDPERTSLGAPVSNLERMVTANGITMSRVFEGGTVSLSFDSSGLVAGGAIEGHP